MSQYLGDISAYALAVSQGYTGTEEEYAELMASYATVGQTAVNAAQTATTKASEAATSATTATNKATEATTAAQTATTKAGEASASANTATSAKDTAVSASQTATTKATEATTAAETATSAATTATTAKDDAVSAKTAAQTAQTGAETAAASVQSSAEQIQTNADDISELKEDLTTIAPKEDMLKAFPTDTASGSVASFADGANVPVKSLIVNIDPVQSGSGDPSPDNVRPISGWSEVNVNACGVNVWDEDWEHGYYDTNGQFVSSNIQICSRNYIPVVSGKSYYIKASGQGRICFFDSSKTLLRRSDLTYFNTTINIPTNCSYIMFHVDGTIYNHDISINFPSTDHDYHQGGQIINIQLGQTVYGGKLYVVGGELTLEGVKNIYDGSDDEDWQVNSVGSGLCTMVITDDTTVNVSANTDTSINVLSDRLLGQSANDIVYNRTAYKIGIITNHRFMVTVKDTDATGITGFKSWLVSNPITVCYKLATPIAIQLTPHEVRSLLGDNNVWADTGDTAVEYRADPTLYIGRLTEPDADMVADANITSGQYFMVGNTLYKATANIASGASIVPNVNCTRKSLSEALNELNA